MSSNGLEGGSVFCPKWWLTIYKKSIGCTSTFQKVASLDPNCQATQLFQHGSLPIVSSFELPTVYLDPLSCFVLILLPRSWHWSSPTKTIKSEETYREVNSPRKHNKEQHKTLRATTQIETASGGPQAAIMIRGAWRKLLPRHGVPTNQKRTGNLNQAIIETMHLSAIRSRQPTKTQ